MCCFLTVIIAATNILSFMVGYNEAYFAIYIQKVQHTWNPFTHLWQIVLENKGINNFWMNYAHDISIDALTEDDFGVCLGQKVI